MKLLTIVIPSYNTESFIDKNMKTFLDERLYDKVDLLIIDDGSKDRTKELAGNYAELYRDYVRVISKENGGHGSVINLGIREAKGKYFKIVDADDWINTDNLVRLVIELETSDADVIINPFMIIDQQTQKEQLYSYKEVESLPPESSFDFFLQKSIYLKLHSITYKTSILRKNHIAVTEKCFYEDWQYDLYPVPYIKTVTVLDYPIYWYLLGQKTQSVEAKNAMKNVEMAYTVFCDMAAYYESNKQLYSPLVEKYMENSIGTFLRSIYNIYLRNYKEKDSFALMKIMDSKIRLSSQQFYDFVGNKNPYIKCLRKGSKGAFVLMGFLLSVYKFFATN